MQLYVIQINKLKIKTERVFGFDLKVSLVSFSLIILYILNGQDKCTLCPLYLFHPFPHPPNSGNH